MSIEHLIYDRKYKTLIERQSEELLIYMFENDIRFNIVCNIATVTFAPELPESISEKFKPLTLFAISGYTFESATIHNKTLIFQAGFGPANYASEVKIPLFSIMQVVLEENVIFINMIAGNEVYIKEWESKRTDQKSLGSFLSNPKNKALLKNLRKE